MSISISNLSLRKALFYTKVIGRSFQDACQVIKNMQWYDIVFIIISLIVIVLSLLQGGKSEGASGAITGGGLNVFAKTKERGSEKVISWLTFGFAILFLFLAILIMLVGGKSSSSDASSSTDSAAAAMAFLPYIF